MLSVDSLYAYRVLQLEYHLRTGTQHTDTRIIELVRAANPVDSHLIFRLYLRLFRGEKLIAKGRNREIIELLELIHRRYP